MYDDNYSNPSKLAKFGGKKLGHCKFENPELSQGTQFTSEKSIWVVQMLNNNKAKRLQPYITRK